MERDYDFRRCKFCNSPDAAPAYRLGSGATVFRCAACNSHYIDVLDCNRYRGGRQPHDEDEQVVAAYIQQQLQHNRSRFQSQVALTAKHLCLSQSTCLDVGAGGGLFMSMLRDRGAQVYGIEPNPARRKYIATTYGIEVTDRLLDNPWWNGADAPKFDAVTLWDVIEHVDFPVLTLECAYRTLKPGGILFLDTPTRDGCYYRTGELAYVFTGGRQAGFLNVIYSSSPYGHKQIFTTAQMRDCLRRAGFRDLIIRKVHELSFPYVFYLNKLFRSAAVARALVPFAKAFFRVVPIRNKMIVVARKP
jgi:SAM-dependent methyltransferase